MFKYSLGMDVSLILSSERGVVVARGEYLHGENQYLVRYLAADGRQVEAWWNESALTD